MPRFVVQRHDRQGQLTHWDLMLEQGDVLKTFRLDRPPVDVLTEAVSAIAIADHPVRFLTYEGSVNQGLGCVQIAERGTYTATLQTQESWDMEMDGAILRGRFLLSHVQAERWRLSRTGPGLSSLVPGQ
jgi:bifunctional non-homologous end joining protein LigD